MTKKIGIIKDDRYLLHKSIDEKLENPNRLSDIYDYLKVHSGNYNFYEPKSLVDSDIEKIHSSFYINQIKKYSEDNYHNYDKDTYLNNHSYDIAKLAAGGCCTLADKIMNYEIDKGFALIRPPGHHAEVGRAMGFCIFNNIAITARYLIDVYGLERILIVDFDAHHGNGTQEIFYDDSNVLTLSIHQNNIFPYGGKLQEIGKNKAEGFNINVPVHPFFGDNEYSYIFGKVVQQVVENFLPQVILVSAGYDAHIDDNASDLKITNLGYQNISKSLVYLANTYSNGRLLFTLEGGYNIKALTSSVLDSIEILSSKVIKPPGFMFSERADKVIEKLPQKLKTKWNI